jgi:hypothetical protein
LAAAKKVKAKNLVVVVGLAHEKVEHLDRHQVVHALDRAVRAAALVREFRLCRVLRFKKKEEKVRGKDG